LIQGSVPYSLRFIVEAFEMTAGQIAHTYTPDATVDIVLTLGDDWAANNLLP